MLSFLFLNKSAPDVTDFVLLVIGILLGLLLLDYGIAYIRKKMQQPPDMQEETLIDDDPDAQISPDNPNPAKKNF